MGTRSSIAVVRYLVEKHGCDPAGKDEQGNTPLHLAAAFGNLDIVVYVIEQRKCDPILPGRWGRTPLHNACGKNGNLAVVKYLVKKHGDDVQCRDLRNHTPLDIATNHNCREIIQYLLHLSSLKTAPKLDELMSNVAAAIPEKWKQFGVQLKIPPSTLEDIMFQNEGEGEGEGILSFEQVFKEWERQKTSPYTWETVINVLRTPGIAEYEMAARMLA
eukprot:Em0019g53a